MSFDNLFDKLLKDLKKNNFIDKNILSEILDSELKYISFIKIKKDVILISVLNNLILFELKNRKEEIKEFLIKKGYKNIKDLYIKIGEFNDK